MLIFDFCDWAHTIPVEKSHGERSTALGKVP